MSREQLKTDQEFQGGQSKTKEWLRNLIFSSQVRTLDTIFKSMEYFNEHIHYSF